MVVDSISVSPYLRISVDRRSFLGHAPIKEIKVDRGDSTFAPPYSPFSTPYLVSLPFAHSILLRSLISARSVDLR